MREDLPATRFDITGRPYEPSEGAVNGKIEREWFSAASHAEYATERARMFRYVERGAARLLRGAALALGAQADRVRIFMRQPGAWCGGQGDVKPACILHKVERLWRAEQLRLAHWRACPERRVRMVLRSLRADFCDLLCDVFLVDGAWQRRGMARCIRQDQEQRQCREKAGSFHGDNIADRKVTC